MEKLVQLEKFAPDNTLSLNDYKELAKKIKVLKKLTKKIKKLYNNPH